MNLPKVTIITVAFNSEKTIEDTINSVISQSYPNIEYIIIDGKSTDNTLKICHQYKTQISVLKSQKDKGIYDAMNKGIELATGDIVGILNSDDFYTDDNVITDIVNNFMQSNAKAVYANLVYVDSDNTNQIKRTWTAGKYKPNSFLKGWMPPHPTFFLTKDCYTKFGKYTLKLKSAADYELMLRMIHKHQIPLSYLNRVIIKMRVGGVSNASITNRLKANKEDRMAWEMNNLKPNKLTLIQKPLSKLTQFFRR